MSNDWTSLSVSRTFIGYLFDSVTRSNSVVYLSTSQINGLLVHVVFQNMNFAYNNNAAEVLYAETMSSFDNIKSLAVHFSDLVVDGNMIHKNYLYTPGGIMTFVEVAAVYLSDTNFTRNAGSVIEAHDTDVHVYMSGNVYFQYNYGSKCADKLG